VGQDGKRRPQGLGEFFFNELRQAIQDIRQKAVEQGWFGRVTTPKPVVEMPFQSVETAHEIDGQRRLSFEEQWAPKERSDPPRDRTPEHEIDR